MSPEIFKKNYNEKCDIWSIGVILYLMLSGELPFKGKNNKEMAEQILMGKYNFDSPAWKNVSNEAQQFIQKLLEIDPEKRYSASEALQDPWITSNVEKPVPNVLADEAINNLRTYRVL